MFWGVRTAECIDEYIRYRTEVYDRETGIVKPSDEALTTSGIPNGIDTKSGTLVLLSPFFDFL